VLHDGILAPVVLGVGATLGRLPRRARAFVQGGLLAGALITVIAVPMIYRRNSQPKVKAILQQNFGLNLVTLLAIVLAGTALLYVVRVLRDRQAVSATKTRPSDDQPSSSA
jgi:nitrate reductase gamma subunit